jgi:hypothetical protein
MSTAIVCLPLGTTARKTKGAGKSFPGLTSKRLESDTQRGDGGDSSAWKLNFKK